MYYILKPKFQLRNPHTLYDDNKQIKEKEFYKIQPNK